uniref:BTB domain-containing protein n=1 Tax=Cairina moschata TaxID=8855 RepID=A0A8C3CF21_CAIMO
MAAEGGRVQISFPQHAAALLESLNRLRLEGKFCDVAVHVGGRVFPAHKSVLAAASPFFHDKNGDMGGNGDMGWGCRDRGRWGGNGDLGLGCGDGG